MGVRTQDCFLEIHEISKFKKADSDYVFTEKGVISKRKTHSISLKAAMYFVQFCMFEKSRAELLAV